jgi:hypothetical protein
MWGNDTNASNIGRLQYQASDTFNFYVGATQCFTIDENSVQSPVVHRCLNGLQIRGDGDGATDSLWFGLADDASIFYNGTDLVIRPSGVGTGKVEVQGTLNADALTIDGVAAGGDTLTVTSSGQVEVTDILVTSSGQVEVTDILLNYTIPAGSNEFFWVSGIPAGYDYISWEIHGALRAAVANSSSYYITHRFNSDADNAYSYAYHTWGAAQATAENRGVYPRLGQCVGLNVADPYEVSIVGRIDNYDDPDTHTHYASTMGRITLAADTDGWQTEGFWEKKDVVTELKFFNSYTSQLFCSGTTCIVRGHKTRWVANGTLGSYPVVSGLIGV